MKGRPVEGISPESFNDCINLIDEEKYCGVAFSNSSRAFDKVSHFRELMLKISLLDYAIFHRSDRANTYIPGSTAYVKAFYEP